MDCGNRIRYIRFFFSFFFFFYICFTLLLLLLLFCFFNIILNPITLSKSIGTAFEMRAKKTQNRTDGILYVGIYTYTNKYYRYNIIIKYIYIYTNKPALETRRTYTLYNIKSCFPRSHTYKL